MKAIVKKEAKPGLWMLDVDEPKVLDHEVLIKVKKASICGTDVHIYQWDKWAQKTIPTPLTIGHEFMGEVVEIGKYVKSIKVGDRVSCEGHIACSICRNCLRGRKHLCVSTVGVGVQRNGGFADYVAIPAENAFLLDDSIDDETGSILDPLGNATHTALSFDLVGEDVWIIGAGPIGMMATAIAKYAGARNIFVSDVNDYRLKMAGKMGATRTVNIQKESIEDAMKQSSIQFGFDVVMEMSGNEKAFQSMFPLMMHSGRVALLGIPKDKIAIDWNDVIFKGIEIKGIYGREMFETWYKMASMLQSGLNIKNVITHRFDKDDFEEAFKAMESGASGKIVLNWD